MQHCVSAEKCLKQYQQTSTQSPDNARNAEGMLQAASSRTDSHTGSRRGSLMYAGLLWTLRQRGRARLRSLPLNLVMLT